jgi:hypothetical protein
VAKFLGVHNQQSGSHAPQSVCPALDRLRYLFTNDIVRLLVGSQPQEDWLTKLVVVGPLGKFNLSDQHGFDPLATLHHRRRNAKAPSTLALLRQIYERTRRHPEPLKLRVEIRQHLVRKTRADSAGEHEPI